MKTTIYADLGTSLKLQQREGESLLDFAKRVTKKVNSLDDAGWAELSDQVQRWYNAVMEASELAGADSEPEIPTTVDVKDKDGEVVKTYKLGWPDDDAEEASSDDDSGEDGEADEESGDDETSDDDESEEEDDGEGDGDSEDEGEGESDDEDGGSGEDEESSEDEEKTVDEPSETDQEESSSEDEPEAKPAKAAKKPAKAKAKEAKPQKSKDKPTTGKGKAKEMVTKSAPKSAKSAATTNARTRIDGTQIIKILTKGGANPHREKTKNYASFAKYKDGMTVDRALKAGIPQKNIYYEAKTGNIKLVKAAKEGAKKTA